PSGAIDRRRNPNYNGRNLDWCAVGSMGAKIQALATADLLIEVKKRTGRRDIVRFSRLAPGRAVFRSSGDDNRQTQRHTQGKPPLFVVVGSVHQVSKQSAVSGGQLCVENYKPLFAWPRFSSFQ